MLRSDSYPLSELAAAAAACAPSQLYARHLGAPFVARLPNCIRCSRWLLSVMHLLDMTQHHKAVPIKQVDKQPLHTAPLVAKCLGHS
jgi:hypothetical protein